MDCTILRVPSGLRIGDRVSVTERTNNEISFEGTVVFITVAPIHKCFPYGNTTEYIYIKFDKEKAYLSWLKRGSPLIVYRSSLDKCVVREIISNGDKFQSVTVGSEYSLFPPICISGVDYTITPDKIDSMLIWRQAYNIQRI